MADMLNLSPSEILFILSVVMIIVALWLKFEAYAYYTDAQRIRRETHRSYVNALQIHSKTEQLMEIPHGIEANQINGRRDSNYQSIS